MKYFVNESCIGCGLCASVCPEVFEMTDDGVAVASEEEVPTNMQETAAQVQSDCPVGAIENNE